MNVFSSTNGEELFKENCIDCHINKELKAPNLDAIGMMSRESIFAINAEWCDENTV